MAGNPRLFACGTCGKPTALGPLMCEDGSVHLACCAECYDRSGWDPPASVPAAQCDAETLKQAEKARLELEQWRASGRPD